MARDFPFTGGSRRSGFTLAEAMVALTITALAGSVVLLAIDTSLQNSDDAVDRAIAAGMAKQLMDEVMGCRYRAIDAAPTQYPLSASAYEQAGSGRERYDDSDDFVGFTAQGAEDVWGQPLATGNNRGGLKHPTLRLRTDYFAKWRQRIDVYYVSDTNMSQRKTGSATSNHRAVEVVISKQDLSGVYHELARLRRVCVYVPAN